MPTWLATKVRGMTSEVSPLSAQRAQFTFSTQGIVTHSQARGGEAGSQPTFFRRARGFVQTFNWRARARMPSKSNRYFFFCAPRPSARTTPVTPFFYLPYPFVLPRSSRPRNLTQIVQFFHFLFNFLESEVIKGPMRTVSTSPYKNIIPTKNPILGFPVDLN